MEDGLGDTVRVSLTEEPEAEAPVASMLINQVIGREKHAPMPEVGQYPIDPYAYNRRRTREVGNFGAENVPRVIADFSSRGVSDVKDLKAVGHFYLPELDKWSMNDLGADYVFTGDKPANFMLPNGLKEVLSYAAWTTAADKANKYPLLSLEELKAGGERHPELNFLLT